MMKQYIRFVLILMVIALAVPLIAAHAQNSARIWLSPDTLEANAGEEFTVTVNIEGADGVYGTSFKLGYDAAALEVVLTNNQAITPADFFSGGPNFALKNTASDGAIEYALTLTQPAEPVSGGGVIGTITFRALTAGAVQITPLEASLVSPHFEEVNGRRVATSIQQVTTQIEGAAVQVRGSATGNTASVAAVVPPTGNTASVATASVANSQPQPVIASAASVTSSAAGKDSLLTALAGGFLLGGMLLLGISVWLYSRMRAHLELVG
ncbi:MAG: cohesin domain-containing protein [Anaerolineae bacterium]|nr:cohesin domain-containing protein [Anaerolineae bacterium]